MTTLSIVLPVYNVEKYIEDCVRSLEAQDIPHDTYELIAVDDGAMDRSVEIIEKLQKEFDNILLVRQSNKGLAGARNTGLRKASGKYVMFVDPDDCVTEGCFGELLATANRFSDLDLIGFNYKMHLNSGLIRSPVFPPPTENAISGMEFYRHYVCGGSYAWRYLFSREFLQINGLTYLEGITFEDVEILPRIMSLAKRTYYCDLIVYHYFLRPGSLSTTFSERHVFSRLAAAENLFRFVQARGDSLPREERAMVEGVMAECALAAVSCCPPDMRHLRRLFGELRAANFYPIPLHVDGRHRFESQILNRSIPAYWIYAHIKGIVLMLTTKLASVLAVLRQPQGMRLLRGRIKRTAA